MSAQTRFYYQVSFSQTYQKLLSHLTSSTALGELFKFSDLIYEIIY